MPFEIDRRAFLQLSLLLLAVPIQYYLVTMKSSSEEKKLESLQSIWTNIRETHLILKESWPLKGCIQFTSRMISSVYNFFGESRETEATDAVNPLGDSEESDGESPAVEVLKKKFSWSNSGHFASSMEPRYPRPSKIKFRIGQVVKHKRWGYRGVIVGWDAVAKAPESWIKDNHENNKSWRDQPNYAVLIDIRDRTIPQLGYVPEVNIEIAPSSVRITHPGMEDYFESYDGAQYLPRPWLRTIYPMDT